MANWNINEAFKLYDLPYEFILSYKEDMKNRDRIYGIDGNYNLANLKRAELGIKD